MQTPASASILLQRNPAGLLSAKSKLPSGTSPDRLPASIVAMAQSSRRVDVPRGASLWLSVLLLLLLSGSAVTPALGSPTALPPADHESILHALRFQGLTATADALDNVIWNRGFLVPPSATLFIPLDDAMKPVAAALNVTELIALLASHIVPENLPVGKLTSLPAGTKLPTMATLANPIPRELLVTENSKATAERRGVMTINHQEVMPQDLCTISTVACYAVKEVLVESATGSASNAGKMSFSQLTDAPLQAPMLTPPGLPLPLPLPPLGAPEVPPVDSPLGSPVPAGAPTYVLPPPERSPGDVPVPTPEPVAVPSAVPSAVPVAGPVGVPSGSPAALLPRPGSPGGSPMSSPAESPEGAPSAAMVATAASMTTLAAAVVLTIWVLQ